MARERRFSFGAFFSGLLLGLLIAVLAGAAAFGYLLRHPRQMISRAMDLGAKKVVTRTVQSIPKQYVAAKQEVINLRLNQFVEAYHQNRISQEDIDRLSQKAFETAADQKITPEEFDEMLALLRQVSSE